MPKLVGGSKPEAVPAPKVMPTPDDDAINAAKRQKAAAIAAQSGRASTIYSQNSGNNASNTFG